MRRLHIVLFWMWLASIAVCLVLVFINFNAARWAQIPMVILTGALRFLGPDTSEQNKVTRNPEEKL